MAQPNTKRKTITKKVRFEVFKRDSFQCQYCGASAPEVVLNVDHIKPVAKGGDNNILNLITSCFSCNSGKSDRKLSDQSTLAKQKAQIDELNKKREQLQMLHDYRDSVSAIDEEKVIYITDMINDEIEGKSLNEFGIRKIKKLVKKSDYKILLSSIEDSMRQYLKYDSEGLVISSSVENMFTMIPRVYKSKLKGDYSEIKDATYIRAILRNRSLCSPKSKQALAVVYNLFNSANQIDAYESAVEHAKEFARDCADFEEFIFWCEELTEEYQEHKNG